MAALAAVSVAMVALTAFGLWYAIVFPRQPFRGPLPPLDDAAQTLSVRLTDHLHAIAASPHNLAHEPALEAAARAIEDTLRSIGYRPRAQIYEVQGRPVRNIEITVGPSESDRNPPLPILILGAHYDSAGESPGANDNGSGVAAVIEIARALRDFTPSRHRLQLVFWVNEEAPWGKTPAMGSWQHAQRLSQAREPVAGVIALETLGYFSNAPGSQKFPWPFGHIYSDRGNFVAFVGLPGSRTFLRRSLAGFRRNAAFPSIGGVAPGFLEGIDLSDHWSYAQFGYPALMVTDTAPFRNPFYHSEADLPDTVDTQSLARITLGLIGMLKDLA